PMKATLLDNKIRAVATTGKERSPFFADVPTVAEAGVPGYEVVSWNGGFAPRGTPADVIALLNKTIREIVATPEVKQRYAELGIEAKASTPEELRARLAGDIGKWAAVIERAGIPKQQRHVGVAAFPVNNRPETGKANQRSFPAAAG